MERSNGRSSPNEVRYPHIALNVLAQCHSSCCVEIGNTRVVCGVHHPQQLLDEYRGHRGRVSCTVHRSARSGQYTFAPNHTAPDEADISLALEGVAEQVVVLETIPQLLVEVVVEILSEDGAVWDAAATAMSAALANGGFDMYDGFSACVSALLPDGAVVTDPDEAEETSAHATALVCTALHSGSMYYVSHQGMCEPATVSELISAAVKGSLARKAAIREQLVAQSAF